MRDALYAVDRDTFKRAIHGAMRWGWTDSPSTPREFREAWREPAILNYRIPLKLSAFEAIPTESRISWSIEDGADKWTMAFKVSLLEVRGNTAVYAVQEPIGMMKNGSAFRESGPEYDSMGVDR